MDGVSSTFSTPTTSRNAARRHQRPRRNRQDGQPVEPGWPGLLRYHTSVERSSTAGLPTAPGKFGPPERRLWVFPSYGRRGLLRRHRALLQNRSARVPGHVDLVGHPSIRGRKSRTAACLLMRGSIPLRPAPRVRCWCRPDDRPGWRHSINKPTTRFSLRPGTVSGVGVRANGN